MYSVFFQEFNVHRKKKEIIELQTFIIRRHIIVQK